MTEIVHEISELLQQGKVPKVKELVQKALDEGVAPQDILNNGLLGGLDIIGGKFKRNEVFVPQVLIAARAMNAGVEILKPYMMAEGFEEKGTVILGTVKGDLHDIGKNIVKTMFEGKGLKVIDLGVDVSADRFFEAAEENQAKIVACSALLTTTMAELKTVVETFAGKGARDKYKIMIGGAPVNQDFCDLIGADCYTPDATTAAEAAVKFCL